MCKGGQGLPNVTPLTLPAGFVSQITKEPPKIHFNLQTVRSIFQQFECGILIQICIYMPCEKESDRAGFFLRPLFFVCAVIYRVLYVILWRRYYFYVFWHIGVLQGRT